MDISFIEALIPNIAAFFNIEPATVLLLWIVGATMCNITSRMIPDSAGGWLGTVRNITRVIGLHVPNRVLPRVTVDELAADAVVAATQKGVPSQVRDYLKMAKEMTSEKPGEESK